jgi:nicotinamidase-related amidase
VKALIIIDMLQDFVDGKLANPRAQVIVPSLQRLLEHARRAGWVVVFSNDAHEPSDREISIWGEHAMAGTPGAQVVEALQPQRGDLIVPKRLYGAFDGTDLGRLLHARGVDEVVLTGQHTHICVRHASYGAFQRGLAVTVPRDAVCTFEGVDDDQALDYLHSLYGAPITPAPSVRPASSGLGPVRDSRAPHPLPTRLPLCACAAPRALCTLAAPLACLICDLLTALPLTAFAPPAFTALRAPVLCILFGCAFP